jgi:hypothetical protein
MMLLKGLNQDYPTALMLCHAAIFKQKTLDDLIHYNGEVSFDKVQKQKH